MLNLSDDLNRFRFIKKGNIVIKKNQTHPIFELFSRTEEAEGNVYMWIVETKGKPSQVLYIGKAGTTISLRVLQHTSGFKGTSRSKIGESNAAKLVSLLKKKAKISLYVRHSQRMKILDQKNISLCDVEEKALIERYKDYFPLFNLIRKIQKATT
jgi:hypothetical protein